VNKWRYLPTGGGAAACAGLFVGDKYLVKSIVNKVFDYVYEM
jgi:hypothetical protein